MSGYVCIYMLEDPHFNVYSAATKVQPKDWCATFKVGSRLLYFERFNDPVAIYTAVVERLRALGICATENERAFTTLTYVAIHLFIQVRDELVFFNSNTATTVEEGVVHHGARLNNLATNYKNGIRNAIPDSKMFFNLFKQSTGLGYKPAFLALAHIFLDGGGVRNDLNPALQWAQRLIALSKPCGPIHSS